MVLASAPIPSEQLNSFKNSILHSCDPVVIAPRRRPNVRPVGSPSKTPTAAAVPSPKVSHIDPDAQINLLWGQIGDPADNAKHPRKDLAGRFLKANPFAKLIIKNDEGPRPHRFLPSKQKHIVDFLYKYISNKAIVHFCLQYLIKDKFLGKVWQTNFEKYLGTCLNKNDYLQVDGKIGKYLIEKLSDDQYQFSFIPAIYFLERNEYKKVCLKTKVRANESGEIFLENPEILGIPGDLLAKIFGANKFSTTTKLESENKVAVDENIKNIKQIIDFGNWQTVNDERAKPKLEVDSEGEDALSADLPISAVPSMVLKPEDRINEERSVNPLPAQTENATAAANSVNRPLPVNNNKLPFKSKVKNFLANHKWKILAGILFITAAVVLSLATLGVGVFAGAGLAIGGILSLSAAISSTGSIAGAVGISIAGSALATGVAFRAAAMADEAYQDSHSKILSKVSAGNSSENPLNRNARTVLSEPSGGVSNMRADNGAPKNGAPKKRRQAVKNARSGDHPLNDSSQAPSAAASSFVP